MSSSNDLDRKIDERIAKNEEQQETSELADLLIETTDMFSEDDREDLETSPLPLLRKLVDEKVSDVAANLAAQRRAAPDADDWPSSIASDRSEEIAAQEAAASESNDEDDWGPVTAGERLEQQRGDQ